MEWVQLDSSKLRNVGGAESTHLQMVFGLNGELWPRLVLCVVCYPQERSLLADTGDNFVFGLYCNTKQGPGAWWEKAHCPKSLLPYAIELLEDAQEVFCGKDSEP
jgi:hypothetical protein